VVAADKTPAPTTVERVKRTFSAILYTPPCSLSIEQKERDTRTIGHSNDHERDALAAALDAWRSLKNKLDNVEKKAPAGIEVDELKMLVLRGHTIESSINLLKKSPAAERDSEQQAPTTEKDLIGPDILYLKAIIKRQDEQIARLLSYVSELRQSLHLNQEKLLKLDDKIKAIQSHEARAIKQHKEIALRQKEIERLTVELANSERTNRSLNKRITKLKQIGKTENTKPVKAVKIVNAFNREAIEAADRHFGLDKSIVLLEDASGGGLATADTLASKGVRAIIVKNEMSHAAQKRFFEANIPIFSITKLPLGLSGSILTVDKEALDRLIEQSKNAISEMKLHEKQQRLESLIDAYKHQRITSSQRHG